MLANGEGLGIAYTSEVKVNNMGGYICALFHAILPAYLYILTNVHFSLPDKNMICQHHIHSVTQ